jgi:hypothetical protein
MEAHAHALMRNFVRKLAHLGPQHRNCIGFLAASGTGCKVGFELLLVFRGQQSFQTVRQELGGLLAIHTAASRESSK